MLLTSTAKKRFTGLWMRLKVMLHIFYVFVAGSIMIICIQPNHKVRADADGASRFFFVKLGWCPPPPHYILLLMELASPSRSREESFNMAKPYKNYIRHKLKLNYQFNKKTTMKVILFSWSKSYHTMLPCCMKLPWKSIVMMVWSH